MQPHPDLDQLALHALGEPVLPPESLSHLTGCPRCRTTVDELTATVATARGPELDDVRAVPVPAHVWQGIAAELDLDPTVRPASVGPSVVPAAPEAQEPAAATGAPPAPSRRDRHRPGGGLRLLAVAAAGLVVGAAGTALVVQPRSEGSGGDPVVLAAADLEAFGAGEGTAVGGSARLTSPVGSTAGSGSSPVLELSLDDLPDTGADYLEVWLIDPGTGGMVSLGPVSPEGTGAAAVALAVPAGIDVAAFALVDVSSEPPDGDPTHSGVSLVRGTLGT